MPQLGQLGPAPAEAMTLARRSVKSKSDTLIVAGDCHPQTIEVIRTRAATMDIQVRIAATEAEWHAAIAADDYFAALNQYPGSSGWLCDWSESAQTIHDKKAALILAADLLALTLLKAPGEMGADIVIGTTQRFGMPMGAGGPHAAYMACRDEYKRSMPGRLVGISVDVHGNPAYRLALQTREQHIRREKATSNICTAQVLPAVVASMYAVYHGPEGLRQIASRVHNLTRTFATGLKKAGFKTDLQVVDWATLVQRRNDAKLWDVYFTHSGLLPEPMLSPPQLGDGAPGWWDSADKKASLAAFNQETNPTKRGALWGKVQQVVYDEVPFIEVGKFNSLSARSAKLVGYTPAVWPFFWNTGLKN